MTQTRHNDTVDRNLPEPAPDRRFSERTSREVLEATRELLGDTARELFRNSGILNDLSRAEGRTEPLPPAEDLERLRLVLQVFLTDFEEDHGAVVHGGTDR